MGCPVCSTRNKVNAEIRTKFKSPSELNSLIARIRNARIVAKKSAVPSEQKTKND